MTKGNIIISLDFELFWGVKDSRPLENYRANLIGVRQVLPKLLNLFAEHGIHGTFSTVGFLFFDTKQKLVNSKPSILPAYQNMKLSNFAGNFWEVGENEDEDKIHFGSELIKLISTYPNQEIGTHTFSHYYCLEDGADIKSFAADIEAAKKVMGENGYAMTSLVFPRHQAAKDFLKVCKDAGILCYRGNENHWIYSPSNNSKQTKLRRALRLIDTYINISGQHCSLPLIKDSQLPIDIPASRFLRPYSKTLSILEPLRLARIKNGMTHAAKHNLTYHLWWHPHNFGIQQEKNLSFLKKILKHYDMLKEQYGFESLTMTELAKRILDE
jgi:peptidoglycan/xylan/chitin deacetylase (PgdA/CDA1 family)